MFKHILTAFTASAPENLPPMDGSLALCALMVRIARADDDYSPAEQTTIKTLMKRSYNLSDSAALDLMTEAETLEASAPDTVRFTRKIKETVPHDTRKSVLESLWTVALADGQRDVAEDSYMRLAVRLLGLQDVDSALARQKVERLNV